VAKQRTVDVNINYHMNIIDGEKANALLNKVSQITDKLGKDTQNFGNVAGKSFQQTSKYIEGMDIQLAKLRQQIRLTNTQDTARLAQLSSQYKALKSQIDAYNKSLFESSRAQKESAQNTRELSRQFGDVVTAVKAFIAAGLVREVVNISLEMAKLSGNVEGVSLAFNKQIPGAESVLLRLRSATQGTVNDLELMQRALQAQNFGIDVQRLPELLEFAAIRAQQTGQSVDYLVNSIVMGIGRKSLLVLDNLGISATRLKEEFNGAALASKTVGEVTQGVANIAQAEMTRMGGYIHTSATEVDQLTTSWHELRVEVSKFGTEGATGGIVGVLKDYVDSFKALVESFNRGIPVSQVFAEKQRQIVAEMTVNEFISRRFTKSKEENIKVLEEEIGALTTQLGKYAEERDATEKSIEWAEKEFLARRGNQYVIRDNINLIEQGLKIKTDDALIDQATLKLLQARLIALKAVNKEEGKTGEGGKRSLAVADLRQTIDLDLKNPVTGEVGKYDKDNIIKAFTEMVNLLPAGSIPPLKQPVEITPMTGWERLGEQFADNWREVVNAGIMDTTDVINSFVQAEADSYDARLNTVKKFYDEQIALAGDNERAKAELAIKRNREEEALRRKSFEAEKEAQQKQTLIHGAAGVIRAFATLDFYEALFASAIIAGETLAQVAVIGKQQYKGYKTGGKIKGPGTETSDSIPILASKNEFMVKADSANKSPKILEQVNSGKLNDKMLKDIMSGRSGGSSTQLFNDSNIIKKLDEVKNSQPDIVQRGNLIYETRKKSDNYKQWIRSKSMNV
jgi:hypothetical protein